MKHISINISFQPGQRVKLTSPMINEPTPIPVGTEGTVLGINHLGTWAQIQVRWDNGSSLMVCLPDDEICVVV